ncbi:MAG: sialate O-acetylesterase [Cyclobacteriaceae bacterium]
MMKKLSYLVLILATLEVSAQDTFRLFYLGGQSNMVGYGYNKDLPDSLNRTFDNVYIYHGNTADDGASDGGIGIWEALKPGHGVGAKATGKANQLSDRFGLELAFADRLQELYPGEKIALIKYAKGGTSIDSLAAGNFGCWEPDFNSKNGINQYDHFLTTLKNAFTLQDINGDGKPDELIPSGILWMQGESDGDKTEAIALRYYDHLTRLMNLMRAALRTDDLPVLVGKITDSMHPNYKGKVWPYGDLIQYAEEKFVMNDQNAAIIRNTKYYGASDPWHYLSADYIDFGKAFADQYYQLTK